MLAYINDIILDWTIVNTDNYNSSTVVHHIDDFNADSISSHIENDFTEFSITCRIQNIKDSDGNITRYKDERIQQILDLRKNKNLVTFIYNKSYDNLVMTRISNLEETEDSNLLNISFRQVEYATLKRTAEPLPALKTTTATDSKIGKQGTTETIIPDPVYP